MKLHWSENLFNIFMKMVSKYPFSDQNLSFLTWEDKVRLVSVKGMSTQQLEAMIPNSSTHASSAQDSRIKLQHDCGSMEDGLGQPSNCTHQTPCICNQEVSKENVCTSKQTGDHTS